MATRLPVVYRDAWLGSLSESQADRIIKFYSDIEGGLSSIPALESSIFALSDEQVATMRSGGMALNPPLGSLRGYQTLGVYFMLLAQNGILTDSVGLGKTVQTAALINVLNRMSLRDRGRPLRYLYLTEVALVEQVVGELVRFTASVPLSSSGKASDVAKLRSALFSERDSSSPFGIVGSYSLATTFEFQTAIHSWVDEFGKFDLLIVDESAVAKTRTSGITKALKVLRDDICTHRVLLNATPFEQDYTTLYNQLDFVDGSLLPMKSAFERDFVLKNHLTGVIYGYKDLESLAYLMRYRVFGSTRFEQGVTISGSGVNLWFYPLSGVQRGMLSKTRYKEQVFCNPFSLDPSLPVDADAVPKLAYLEQVVSSLDGAQLVVYCKYREAQSLIVDHLTALGVSSIVLNGSVSSAKEKARVVEELRSGKVQVLVTNIQKGLNLEFIDHLFFYSFSANASLMNQVEGRIVRSSDIVGKQLYLPLAASVEYRYLKDAAVNHLYKTQVGKTEVSPLNALFESDLSFLQDCVDRVRSSQSPVSYRGVLSMDGESDYHFSFEEVV